MADSVKQITCLTHAPADFFRPGGEGGHLIPQLLPLLLDRGLNILEHRQNVVGPLMLTGALQIDHLPLSHCSVGRWILFVKTAFDLAELHRWCSDDRFIASNF